jgi:hypothetical protein
MKQFGVTSAVHGGGKRRVGISNNQRGIAVLVAGSSSAKLFLNRGEREIVPNTSFFCIGHKLLPIISEAKMSKGGRRGNLTCHSRFMWRSLTMRDYS